MVEKYNVETLVSESKIEQMLYDGDFEELSQPPYVSYLLKALCDPESAAAEMLEGYEKNLSWDSIIQTQVLSEELIMKYMAYLDSVLLKKHQFLTEKVISAIKAIESLEEYEKGFQKYLYVDAPVYVVTKPESMVKKIIAQNIVDCQDPEDVIGRICFVDETEIHLDNSRHFRSIIYRIPIKSILSIGYICDRPEVETVRTKVAQTTKQNCLKDGGQGDGLAENEKVKVRKPLTTADIERIIESGAKKMTII